MLITDAVAHLTAIFFVFTELASCEKLLGNMSNLHPRLSLLCNLHD